MFCNGLGVGWEEDCLRKGEAQDNDLLFSMSLGMPMNRPRLTSDIRIMGFLRMPKTETRHACGGDRSVKDTRH